MSVAKDRAAGRERIPQSVRFRVFQRDNFTCRYCGVVSGDGITLHVDHARSVKDGGGDDEKNLVTACSDCNYGKGATSISKPSSHKAAAEAQNPGLLGMWGHSFAADGDICWQFKIIRKISGDAHLCQLFSWWTGDATECVPIEDWTLLKDCKLYATNEARAEAYEKHLLKFNGRR